MAKEYIDVAQLFKCETCFHMSVDETCNSFCDCGESYRPAFSKLKTADVVEVVRCKDCVSSRPLRRNDRFEALYAEGSVYCMRNDYGVDNEHFCSFGERKDDNHETSDGN